MGVKERVELEKKELDDKIDKLQKFISGEGFTKIEQIQQELLRKQLKAMLEYSTILKNRLKHLK